MADHKIEPSGCVADAKSLSTMGEATAIPVASDETPVQSTMAPSTTQATFCAFFGSLQFVPQEVATSTIASMAADAAMGSAGDGVLAKGAPAEARYARLSEDRCMT